MTMWLGDKMVAYHELSAGFVVCAMFLVQLDPFVSGVVC